MCSVPCQAPGHSGEWRMAQAQCNRGPLYPALGVPVGRSPSWGGTHHPAALCSPKEPRREARGPRGGQRYTPESGAEVREGTQRAWGHAGDPPARGRGIAGLPGGPLAAIPLCLHPLPSAIRVRPLTCTETRRGDQRVVHSLGDGTVHVSATSPLRGSEGGGAAAPPEPPSSLCPGERSKARCHLRVQRRVRRGSLAGGRVRRQRDEAAGGAGDRRVSPGETPNSPQPPVSPCARCTAPVQALLAGLHCRGRAGRWHPCVTTWGHA